jgi:hypothetical protein
MKCWPGAGIDPQSPGVGEESLPAIRAYLHQVIFNVKKALLVSVFNPCNSKQIYLTCSFQS